MTEPKIQPEWTPALEEKLRRLADVMADRDVVEFLEWSLWDHWEKPAMWKEWFAEGARRELLDRGFTIINHDRRP